GLEDQPDVAADAFAGDHEVDALGGEDLEAAAAAGQGLRLLGPHAGGVDDVAGLDGQALTGLQVEELGPVDPAGRVLRQVDHLGAARGQRAVLGGGADQGDDEPGV